MTGDAPTTPVLLPCPACGAGAVFNADDDGGVWVECASRGRFRRCWRGPSRDEEREARDAWNALTRLADGLRPEPASTGYALLDEAARQALLDTAEGVLWLRRSLTVLAERHGVKLPPAPRPPRRPT